MALEATDEDAARTKELIRRHIDVAELEKEFPTCVLGEHFLQTGKPSKSNMLDALGQARLPAYAMGALIVALAVVSWRS